MTKTVILGGARTPVAKINGSLASKTGVELGAIAIEGALERSGVSPDEVQHVVMGQVLQGGAGQIPSRQAQLLAGIPRTVTSETINRVCGSGLRAVTLADTLIKAEGYDVIVAGGMESMSQAPYIVRNARGGMRMGNGVFEDMMMTDGLFCALDHVQMGLTATMSPKRTRSPARSKMPGRFARISARSPPRTRATSRPRSFRSRSRRKRKPSSSIKTSNRVVIRPSKLWPS